MFTIIKLQFGIMEKNYTKHIDTTLEFHLCKI